MKKLVLIIVLLVMFAVPALASTVTFRWDANTESDLWGYKLYQAETAGGPYTHTQVVGEGNLVAIIPLTLQGFDPANPEFTLLDVADGTHFWVLTARDIANNESGNSNEVTASVDTTPPAPPGGLTVWEVILAALKDVWDWIANLFSKTDTLKMVG